MTLMHFWHKILNLAVKGLKVLIKGNHDDVSDYRYAKLFEEIMSYKEIKDT